MHPSLQILAEANRIRRIAYRLQPLVALEVARAALKDEPLAPSDQPGWAARLLAPRRYPLLPRPFGQVMRFAVDSFFSTGKTPFTGVQLSTGAVAVAFRASARRDLAPVVLRLAVERLFAANGWRMPHDLVRPPAFAAIAELAWSGDPQLRFHIADLSALAAEQEGELALAPDPDTQWSGDRVTLRWTPLTLAFSSSRFGIF